MATYLIEATYTAKGAKGLIQEGGSSRRATVSDMIQKLGGTIEAFYYAFGAVDAYVIVDLPTAASAAAFSLSVNQAGAVQVKTHVLLTPEEVDAAAKECVDYRAPGQ